MKYDVDYFINKLKDIPENKWNTGAYRKRGDHSKRCALGHCGAGHYKDTNDSTRNTAMMLLDLSDMNFIAINDGRDKGYQQPTPKQRILAALYDIKGVSQPKPKELEIKGEWKAVEFSKVVKKQLTSVN